MKQLWLRYSGRINALALRERVAVFIMLVVVLVGLFDMLVLEPQFARERELSQQVESDQQQSTKVEAQIEALVAAYANDPDVAKRKQLEALLQKSNQMRTQLQDMQKGLIAPDKMAPLLQDILQRNGKLHLVSLHTLPVSDLLEPERKGDSRGQGVAADELKKSDGKADTKALPAGSNLVYKHGVEMVVEGSYLDLLDYMQALEAMPWQLFWSKAQLGADDSGKLTLTLTLYTLSLDKNWLAI
ncbi:MAG TPA: type II secretion system protein GspM [Burkholderiaceae bacterium]